MALTAAPPPRGRAGPVSVTRVTVSPCYCSRSLRPPRHPRAKTISIVLHRDLFRHQTAGSGFWRWA
eukprot:5761321-Prymnesium_polylepis.1